MLANHFNYLINTSDEAVSLGKENCNKELFLALAETIEPDEKYLIQLTQYETINLETEIINYTALLNVKRTKVDETTIRNPIYVEQKRNFWQRLIYLFTNR